ncbi:amidohydrolase [Streptomyces sp. NBC_00846]|uniref:amidohydrolase n=1 Tax=Streptomyces sp. NBC_00846 TaxID=2975849 RepID=UPI00386AD260|nr:amidohydrolase [Streptomyces sp. NBC_00846]
MTLVLHGGQVWTGDHSRPHATAVAVADGRITAVGSDTEVRAVAGQAAETVDLAGRSVVPGLQDAHIHPVWGAMEALRCDLTGAADAAQCTALVREYAAADPGRPWILGGGWGMDCFPGGWPTKELLDAVVPDRPVFLPNADHHSAWVNSVALERAGIDASTPDPAAGRIERDAAGRPTGVLHEAAMDLVARVMPESTPQEQRAALRHAQEHLFRYGITGWQDAIVGAYGGAGDTLAAYRRADAEGLLKARVTGALWWDRDRGPEQLDDLLARRGEHGRRFRAGTVKVMQDGVLETGTGALLEPYLDQCGCATGNLGHSNVPAELLTEAVTRLDAAGFQVHFHAIGDRAVRECLDAVAAASRANGVRDRRHHIAHVQLVDDADIGRFAELGVAANIQSLWATHHPQTDELVDPLLGEERARRQYPFRRLLDSGARLAGGSDWPVTTADPWQAMHVAVHRTEPPGSAHAHWPGSDRPYGPEQRLRLTDILRAYTAGSAWVNGNDDETGCLREGMAADLAVLDRDLFAPGTPVAGTRAVLTLVAGEAVHSE